jgi:hypothetical protein
MIDSKPKDSGDVQHANLTYEAYYANKIQGEESWILEGGAFTIDVYDKYIGAQLNLPLQDAMKSTLVITRKCNIEGNPIRRSNTNPFLNTRVYQVAFPDSLTEEYVANVIAKTMYTQVNDEGRQFNIMEEIGNHRKDDKVLSPEEGYVMIRGCQHHKQMTKGWQLCVKWQTQLKLTNTWSHILLLWNQPSAGRCPRP